MRTRTLLRPLAAVALLLGAAPAAATFHLMKIVEVFPGTAAAPQAQYVVLQMYAAGQNLVGGHSVTVHGPGGATIATFTFTGDVANGANQARILVATAQAATFFDVSADLAMTAAIDPAGGKVCFDGIDCVAWGSYAPADAAVGTPFNSAAAPAALTAARGLVPGRALLRRTDLAGAPGTLDAGDDTGVSSNDFVLGMPAPRNDAGQAGTVPSATCGNGSVEGLEGCDDAGSTGGDGCSASCEVEFCGDAASGAGETCDDGNQVSGDGCDANCSPTACGNGLVTAGESCDDGNTASGDGCDANCTPTACGNGVATEGEACDDGDLVSGDGCDANCTPTGCGNGIVTEGEACEPPGVGTCGAACQRICVEPADCADTDPCTTNERCVAEACAVDPTPVDDAQPCTVDSCGPGGVAHAPLEDGTACTLAGQPGARTLCLAAVCVVSSCGDGHVDGAPGGAEACDDGNEVDGDGCTNACTLPRCGDGIVQAGEACDGGAACSATCQRPVDEEMSSGCGCGSRGGGADLALVALLAGALALRGRRGRNAPMR